MQSIDQSTLQLFGTVAIIVVTERESRISYLQEYVLGYGF